MKMCMGCMNQIGENDRICPHCGYNITAARQESYYLRPESIIGGKYIVGKVLNYNGYSVSYMGFDAEANRKVVMKEYLPADFSTRAEGEKNVTIYSGDAMEKFEQGLINFLNEANRIQHLSKIEGIAKVYDCFSENDTGYVISEYMEGHTLKELLDNGRVFTPEEAKIFISSILRGLCLVHPLDIIHCDISPETIMITKSGEIKLLDFGATRYVTTENSKSLAIILKQGYAPEEQYRSQGIRGPWTDVYALGAVMYRMITGIVPQESVERMLNDELKTPAQMGIAIPENLENAMLNALNVYQQERTQSAEMFLRELNSSTVNRLQVKKRKRETGKIPLWAKGLVAGMLCLVIAGGVVFFQLTRGDIKREIVQSDDVSLMELADGKHTYEDAGTYLKKINKDRSWKIDIERDEKKYKYTNDPHKAGKVWYQSVPASADLPAYLKENKKETELKLEGDRKVSGTIKVGLYRSDKFYYREAGNALSLAKMLGVKLTNKDKFKAVEEKGNHTHDYYQIAKIKLRNGTTITGEQLLEDGDKEITKEKIDKTFYYKAHFYYGQIDNFIGKKISGKKYTVYTQKESQKPPNPTGQKGKWIDSNLVDNTYYTFNNKYKKGEVCEQKKTKGFVDSRKERYHKILKVIKHVFKWKGKTGQKAESMIRKKLPTADIRISPEERNNKVEKVEVKQNGKSVEYFSMDKLDEVKIIIRTKNNVPRTSSHPKGGADPRQIRQPE